uniref:Pseudouridine-5'-phosphate glycosidase n=1 Tax=Salix viminalis TaxID=40686 RepID=A0A6N2MI47_SALVM
MEMERRHQHQPPLLSFCLLSWEKQKMESSSSALSRLSNLQRHLHPPHSNSKARYPSSFFYLLIQQGLVKLSPEVAEALSTGHPVVALESTIISHGMPYPKNLETAKEVEAIVRENGAVPATVAILDGVPCVGLSMGELERLATLGTKAQKTARRDIAHVVANRGNGATTVSATMFFASMVGIHVFVTGGIGGVHRHGEQTMDISSDLTELGRTPVAVISAGVKSILDIPRTLEYLETQGVCVAAYNTNEFPAFFTERSGCKVHLFSLNDFQDAICKSRVWLNLLDANLKLKLGTGTLIAVPIPKEHSASGGLIESAIQIALEKLGWKLLSSILFFNFFCHLLSILLQVLHIWNWILRDKNITGNAETPFLLAKVNELTGGASLASNIALVKNNALVGAKIAVALAQLKEHSNRGDAE